MRHLYSGRKLSRRKDHRTAMLANLASSLILKGRINTTDAKAKEVRPFVERMVTFAKRGDVHARRIVLARLKDAAAVKKLFDEIGPKFTERMGGYTRILKLGFRKGDNAPISLMEFVGELEEKKATAKKKKVVKALPKTKAVKEAPLAEKAVDAELVPDEKVSAAAADVAEEVAETTETVEKAEETAEGEDKPKES